jgi:hypothetical protein
VHWRRARRARIAAAAYLVREIGEAEPVAHVARPGAR